MLVEGGGRQPVDVLAEPLERVTLAVLVVVENMRMVVVALLVELEGEGGKKEKKWAKGEKR